MVSAAAITSPAWQNWAGNQSARPRRVITPRSADEVAEAVTAAGAEGLRVRMTGSGHSFTGAVGAGSPPPSPTPPPPAGGLAPGQGGEIRGPAGAGPHPAGNPRHRP